MGGVKFPILIYGDFQFYNSGRIVFLDKKIHIGLYSIGKGDNLLSRKYDMIRLNNNGVLFLKGPLRVLPGAKVFIRKKAKLSIMGGHIGANFRCACTERIDICKNVLMSWDVQCMDSDLHYMMENGIVKKNSRRILIEDNAWISNRVTILKGTILPKNCIIGSNSLLSKDYSTLPPKSVLAGIPARCVKNNIERVQERNIEKNLNEYFNSHPEKLTVNLDCFKTSMGI